MIGIYKIENLKTGKVYIGSSENINERLINHKSMLRCNNHHCIHLQRSYNKHGFENFSFEILEECGLRILEEREQYYIDNNLDKLYNINKTANRGFHGKHKRSSIIQSQRTRGLSSIYKIDLRGNILQEYELCSDIEFLRDRIYKSISKRQTLKNKAFGFIYSKDYITGYIPIIFKSWNYNKKFKQINFKSPEIYVYNISRDFYKKFNSLRDCSIEMNIPRSNLYRMLNQLKIRKSRKIQYLFFTEKQNFQDYNDIV